MVQPYGKEYSAFWILFIRPSGFDLPTLPHKLLLFVRVKVIKLFSAKCTL